jgi:hypothetical protein
MFKYLYLWWKNLIKLNFNFTQHINLYNTNNIVFFKVLVLSKILFFISFSNNFLEKELKLVSNITCFNIFIKIGSLIFIYFFFF